MAFPSLAAVLRLFCHVVTVCCYTNGSGSFSSSETPALVMLGTMEKPPRKSLLGLTWQGRALLSVGPGTTSGIR